MSSRGYSATTDKMAATITALSSGSYTIIAWLQAHGLGGSTNGRIFATADQQFWINNAQKIGGIQTFATASAQIGPADGTTVLTLDQWYCSALTLDTGDSKARSYVGTLTGGMALDATSTAGTGARQTGATTSNLGNFPTADRHWDGRIGLVAVYTRLLTVTEMDAFRTGMVPAGSLQNLWIPDSGKDLGSDGANGTFTGTTLVDDVPVAYGWSKHGTGLYLPTVAGMSGAAMRGARF